MELTKVCDAIVETVELGGKGVIVPGNIILTATHCVYMHTPSPPVTNDWNLLKMRAKKEEFVANVVFAESISDLSVLGEPDMQDYPENNKYLECCSQCMPVQVFNGEFKARKTYKAFICLIDGRRIAIEHQNYHSEAESQFYETNEIIKPGDSGSPIVNKDGELIGVLSSANCEGVKSDGSFPIINQCLPSRLLNIIIDGTMYC